MIRDVVHVLLGFWFGGAVIMLNVGIGLLARGKSNWLFVFARAVSWPLWYFSER